MDRFTKLFQLAGEEHVPECPADIAAGALLQDNESGRLLARLKFKNLSTLTIEDMTVAVRAFSASGAELAGVSKYNYVEMYAEPGEDFGQRKGIRLPDANTASFSVTVTEVSFDDGSIWRPEKMDNAVQPAQAFVPAPPVQQAYVPPIIQQQYAPQQPNVCAQCGSTLAQGQAFCTTCGKQAGTAPIRAAVNGRPGKPKRKPLIIICAAAAAVVIAAAALVLLLGNIGGGPDFNKLYDEYCSSIWADVGADGSYLRIDTNPYDEDDNGLAYYDAYLAIQNVNGALGMPDALLNTMCETTGADGRQSQTFDKVSVSWKYHPDAGLEVTYTKP